MSLKNLGVTPLRSTGINLTSSIPIHQSLYITLLSPHIATTTYIFNPQHNGCTIPTAILFATLVVLRLSLVFSTPVPSQVSAGDTTSINRDFNFWKFQRFREQRAERGCGAISTRFWDNTHHSPSSHPTANCHIRTCAITSTRLTTFVACVFIYTL